MTKDMKKIYYLITRINGKAPFFYVFSNEDERNQAIPTLTAGLIENKGYEPYLLPYGSYMLTYRYGMIYGGE